MADTPDARPLVDRMVRVRSVSADDIVMSYGEMLLISRHPIALIFLAIWISLLILIDLRGEARNLAVWMDTLVYLLCMIIGTVFILIVVGIRRALADRPELLVRATPLSLCVAAILTAFSEWIVSIVNGPILTKPTDLLLLYFFLLVMTEVYMAVLANYVAPAILTELRRNKPPAVVPVSPAPAQMQIAGIALPCAELLQVQALRNQTRIVCTDFDHVVNARFSAVIDDMPNGTGILLHRSHWVSTAAIDGFRRAGRDIIVVLRGGAEVSVAQSRHRELLPWLMENSRRLPSAETL